MCTQIWCSMRPNLNDKCKQCMHVPLGLTRKTLFQITAGLVLFALAIPLMLLGIFVAPIIYFLEARERASAARFSDNKLCKLKYVLGKNSDVICSMSLDRHAKFIQLISGVFELIYEQLRVIVVTCLNFSTSYRMFLIFQSAYKLHVNASIKDMEVILLAFMCNNAYCLLPKSLQDARGWVRLFTNLFICCIFAAKNHLTGQHGFQSACARCHGHSTRWCACRVRVCACSCANGLWPTRREPTRACKRFPCCLLSVAHADLSLSVHFPAC